jgi:hypothetical protein
MTLHRRFLMLKLNFFYLVKIIIILGSRSIPCHAPSVRGALFFLFMLYLIVISWLLGLLCQAGCRHLHVPQNSRQP